jgi:predicted glycosyltransferase
MTAGPARVGEPVAVGDGESRGRLGPRDPRGPRGPRVWIDIDNPPQVQYLLPFDGAFRRAGLETVITARDYGRTVEMLHAAGAGAHVFGERVGRGRVRKGVAAVRRASAQMSFFDQAGRPDVLLAASRASAVAAWRMGIPGFLIGDYEHVHLALYRLTRSKILYPDVIDPAVFVRHGVRKADLIPFRGIKEDLSFAGVDLGAFEAHDLEGVPVEAVKVLFRPPSETSHYYSEGSTTMARAALQWLARAGAVVVFAAREPDQLALLQGLPWSHPPVVLQRSIPFISLLKSVDAVVCAGGTMLREAAYLGIPAYSIFRSQSGAVDRWLEQVGRAQLLGSPADLDRIQLHRRGPLRRLDSNPDRLDQLVAVITAAAGQRRHPTQCLAAA